MLARFPKPLIYGKLVDSNEKIIAEFRCDQDRYLIGRSDASDLVLRSKVISARHCAVTKSQRADGSWQAGIIDQSANGTYVRSIYTEKDHSVTFKQVNGHVLAKNHRFALRDSDSITLGSPNGQNKSLSWTFQEVEPNSILHAYDLHEKYIILVLQPVIDDREIIRYRIGRGQYGEVRKAQDRQTGNFYAVKIMKKRRGLEDKAMERELNIFPRLCHPHIVRFKQSFETPSSRYIVMELVPHGNLRALVMEKKRFHERQARVVVTQVAQALSYLHSLHIVHRDIKPQNILVIRREPLFVKICDFGLAQVVDENIGLQTFCGTAQYIAPEIVDLDSKSYREIVDSYSLGITLFFMLAGNEPFTRSDTVCGLSLGWNYLPRTASIGARDVIDQLTKRDAASRLSMIDLLQHRWLMMPDDLDNGRSAWSEALLHEWTGMNLTASLRSWPPRYTVGILIFLMFGAMMVVIVSVSKLYQ